MAIVVLSGVATVHVSMIPVFLKSQDQGTYGPNNNIIQLTLIILVGVVFGIPAFIAFLLNNNNIPRDLVCFSANVIQQ